MLRKEPETVGKPRNVIYDVDNDGVFIVSAPQSDKASKQGWLVNSVTPELI